MLQSDTHAGGELALPAALLTKRTRCDSPGNVTDASTVGGFAADDTGAPAQDAADGDCTRERGAQQAASPLRGGVSPVRAANKSPRWRAPHGQGSDAAASSLVPRQLASGAEAPAAYDASPASHADASPPPQDDASPPHAEVGVVPEAEQPRCVLVKHGSSPAA